MVRVHDFKNIINKKYQLCLTRKPWPESKLIMSLYKRRAGLGYVYTDEWLCVISI